MYIYGKQLFWYLVERHPEKIEEILLSKELQKSEFKKVASLNKKIIRLDEKKAQSLAKGGAHQGLLAKVQQPSFASFEAIKKLDFLVATVGVTDMGNIGSLIRSSYALGVDALIVSGVKNFSFEAAAKSSSGALFDMPICLFPNTLDMLNELKQVGFELLAAAPHGDRESRRKTKKTVLLLGSEGEGLPKKVLQKADRIVSIEMKNGFDSLNVAVAGAILIDRMRELDEQRS